MHFATQRNHLLTDFSEQYPRQKAKQRHVETRLPTALRNSWQCWTLALPRVQVPSLEAMKRREHAALHQDHVVHTASLPGDFLGFFKMLAPESILRDSDRLALGSFKNAALCILSAALCLPWVPITPSVVV